MHPLHLGSALQNIPAYVWDEVNAFETRSRKSERCTSDWMAGVREMMSSIALRQTEH